MKKVISASLFAAAALFAVGSVSAQTIDLRADIPFAFHAGKNALPAGQYTVKQVNGMSGVSHYVLRDQGTGNAVLVLPNSRVMDPKHAYKPAQMVFLCRERCVLSQIWGGGSDVGIRFRQDLTPREKEAKQVAILLTSGSAQ